MLDNVIRQCITYRKLKTFGHKFETMEKLCAPHKRFHCFFNIPLQGKLITHLSKPKKEEKW